MLLLSLTFALASLSSADFEDLTALNGRLALLGAAAPLDPRLKLPKCPTPPEINAIVPRALAVRCPSLGWRIFVPTEQTKRDTDPLSAPLIRRNDRVDITLREDGFNISGTGTALDAGSLGDTIRIQLGAKAPIMRARVTGAGSVDLSETTSP